MKSTQRVIAKEVAWIATCFAIVLATALAPPLAPNDATASPAQPAAKQEKPSALAFSNIIGEWHSLDGRYLTVVGRMTNRMTDEVVMAATWSTRLEIVLQDGRVLKRERDNRIRDRKDTEGLGGVSVAMTSLLEGPLGPEASSRFEVSGGLWGDSIRVNEAELLYPIEAVKLTLTASAVTPTNLVINQIIYSGKLAPPSTTTTFELGPDGYRIIAPGSDGPTPIPWPVPTNAPL